MPVQVFCRFNSVCVNVCCSANHRHCFEQRVVLKQIVDDTPEIVDMKEEVDPKRKVGCGHGYRCFEKDCGFKHDVNHEGRKIITKKFNKEWKAMEMKEKIRKEIEEIGKNGMKKWE